MSDMKVQIGSLVLKNPVMTASGTFGYGTEYMDFFDVSLLGAIVTKTVTLEPRYGNPLPRIAETPSGMLNSIGLANVGIKRFLSEKLPALSTLDTKVIVNVAGHDIDSYAEVCRLASEHPRTDAIELNISCPNVRQGGLAFGTDAVFTAQVVAAARAVTDKPLIVKLTPNVTDIGDVAMAAVNAGADALSLINTLLGMGIDIHSRRPLIARGLAGLSGPAVKPVALGKVYQVAQKTDVPIIGLGGIMCWEDAIEFFLAGACAVQIGTLNFVDPQGALKVISGIDTYAKEHNISSISELTGAMIAPE
ncbi:dihydroorotate dehydrogenase [bacterium]|nr:dihydroorotate dehydrogenase [bacterium]